MLRLIIGLPVAAIVTAALFFLMGHLVRPGEVVTEGPERTALELPAMRTDRELPRRPVVRPSTDITPPPPVRPEPTPRPTPGPITAPPPARPTPAGGGGVQIPRGLVPIATLNPQYPGSCQARSTEGYAVVRFDVTFEGRVVNASVTDSSHRCFEQAALEAIRAWRYQPALTKESGYIARGETKRFSFRLN